jgi:hypothetical protein
MLVSGFRINELANLLERTTQLDPHAGVLWARIQIAAWRTAALPQSLEPLA